jgi:hypothetical protein
VRPSHSSTTSHGPAATRQAVLAGLSASGGQNVAKTIRNVLDYTKMHQSTIDKPPTIALFGFKTHLKNKESDG